MSNEKIVGLLKSNTLWAKRACREILSRKNDFIPLLINILDEAVADYELAVYDNCSHHIPAALLLSQLREPQAYPRLVELIDCDEDDIDYLWGDIITEYYAWMLRDTYNGDSTLLPQLIEKRSVSEWARAMALRAYGMHYFDGHISREEITGFFRHLIHEVYTGKPDSATETVLSYVADTIREQQLDELIPDVKALYDRNAIDEIYYGSFEDYVAHFSYSIYLAEDTHIDNAIKELQDFNWFEGNKSSEEDSDADDT